MITYRFYFVCVLIFVGLLVVSPAIVFSFSIPDHSFPKIAALYLNPYLTDDNVRTLAHYDVAILDMEATHIRPEMLRKLKQMNPKIILLAYTLPVESRKYSLRVIEPTGDGLWTRLYNNSSPEWFLRDTSGRELVFWQQHVLMNLAAKNSEGKTYAQYLAQFLKTEVIDSGLWDGILFDIVWDGIYWLHPTADLNRDAQPETKDVSDRLWQQGQIELFQTLRSLVGDEKLIIANGNIGIGDPERYSTFVNGRMLEGFPEFYEGSWTGSMKRYAVSEQEGYAPRLNIVNSDSDNTGNAASYRLMRFGLTSTLLGLGYYNFDSGTEDRSKLWYYDEFDVGLGGPARAPFLIGGGKDQGTYRTGVWQRDFQNGIVLVNATNEERRIEFREDFEKIHGKQDRAINDGSIVQEVTIPAEDGIILLRPLDILGNAPFANGSFARVFNGEGASTRTGFFVYDSRYRGSSEVYRLRSNGSDTLTVVADKGVVRVIDANGGVRATFQPYGAGYTDALRLAVGDLNGDGSMDIVTIPGPGKIPAEVRAFTQEGNQFLGSIYPFGKTYTGGGSIALGNVQGDKAIEIIVGGGVKMKPEVRIFTNTGKQVNTFLAYSSSFRGGVNVASGDLDGDERAEIVTGAGTSGGPHIRVFDGKGSAQGKGWFAYKSKRGGSRVAVADLDGDGRSEILALTTDVFTISQAPQELSLNNKIPNYKPQIPNNIQITNNKSLFNGI
ncbi:MAG: VCBS repeat-containing protein [Candidatus Yonathbacteria bacterium]|nr:VCBS repeat-containing protein [Candidatus Yonathbacteria bacterium]